MNIVIGNDLGQTIKKNEKKKKTHVRQIINRMLTFLKEEQSSETAYHDFLSFLRYHANDSDKR